MNIIKEINRELLDIFKKAGYELDSIELKPSQRKDLGDFQINDCMKLASIYHKAPRDIANEIKELLDKEDKFTNVNIAGPGFINITLTDDYIVECVNKIVDNPKDLIEKEFSLKNIDNEKDLINFLQKKYFENNMLKKVNDVIVDKAKINYYPQSLIKIYMQQLLSEEERKIKNYGFATLDDYFQKISGGAQGFAKTKDNYYHQLLVETKKHILIGVVYEDLINQYDLDVNEQDKKQFVNDKLLYYYGNETKANEELNRNEIYYRTIILKNKLLDIIFKK